MQGSFRWGQKCFDGAAWSSQPAPCWCCTTWDCSLYLLGASPRGGTPSALEERGGLLLGGKCQHEWDMKKESSALKWSFPILTLKPWEIAGLLSVLKQDGHRKIKPKPVFTETFPWQQLLSPVKPPELIIKLWAAHVPMSRVPQSSDRLTDWEGTITPLCQTSH